MIHTSTQQTSLKFKLLTSKFKRLVFECLKCVTYLIVIFIIYRFIDYDIGRLKIVLQKYKIGRYLYFVR